MTVNFSKLNGLIPAVVQDADSRDVLMVGFMNDEAFERETSGNRLAVVSMLVDCDDDTVLIQARCEGEGRVCHTGERTCFFRTIE